MISSSPYGHTLSHQILSALGITKYNKPCCPKCHSTHIYDKYRCCMCLWEGDTTTVTVDIDITKPENIHILMEAADSMAQPCEFAWINNHAATVYTRIEFLDHFVGFGETRSEALTNALCEALHI